MLTFDADIQAFRADVAMHEQRGIILPGVRGYLPDAAKLMTCADAVLSALDCRVITIPGLDAAQTPLTTVPNAGIPALLTTFIDPDILRILYSPLKAAQILGGDGSGERKKGDWTELVAMFPIVETTGDVTSYGDYNANGSAGVNVTFPQRQSYHYQAVLQWGERELAMLERAMVNIADQKKSAAINALQQFQNRSYFFGISGLQNYGILNDPSLPAAVQTGAKAFGSNAHGPWVTSGVVTATQNEIFQDFQTLYLQLVTQANGLIELDQETPMVFAVAPSVQIALTTPNAPYNSTTAADLIKSTFPNVRFETAVQYGSAFNTAGNIGQLIATNAGGQDTGYCAFTEKLRAHPVIAALSSWSQKMSQGTWGAINRQPWAYASMYGL